MSKLERFGIGFCAIAAVALVAAMYWPKEETMAYEPVEQPASGSKVEPQFTWVLQLENVAAGDRCEAVCWDSPEHSRQFASTIITCTGTETQLSLEIDLDDYAGTVECIFMHHDGAGGDIKGDANSWFQVAPWIKYGNSRENALAWDDAAKHRYYSHGGTPAGWDFSEDPHGVKSDLPANIVFGGLPVPFNTGDYIARVYLTSPGADILWMEMDLDGQTAGASWSATVEQDGRQGLPHVISDNWAAWLGNKRGPQTLRVDLVKAADGSVIASDTAAWTMTVKQPEVGITAGLVSLDLAGGHSYRM